mmetsp:Transcript_42/g.112  ORF Transcript_42/g.112 Transcript_42/m.112 type:complete len:444 (-) Transcript_42:216-1547(-)
MKRQRDSSASTHPQTNKGDQTGNDCYDEILKQKDDSYSIQDSWFRCRSQVHNNGTDFQTEIVERPLSDEIQSLSQQLIQVKRRLWPAAEKCAAVWKSTPAEEFWSARAFANPMEALGECRRGGLNQMFINRSAIKLANIDVVLGFGLTTPSAIHMQERDQFLFADLCGAPGGFSEYIMKRIRSKGSSHCRGYGISLVGKNEHGKGAMWRLEDHCQNDSEFLSINYRVHYGLDGTGDLYNWKNVKRFQDDIQRDLQEVGITQRKMNLVVADGGFDAQRDSECQEGLAQKLVLCELAAALELIDCGGTLVIKLFGCKTESVRLAMLSIYDFFGSMELIKPVSSRPASSERYAVLSGFKGLPQNWEGGQSWINSILIGRCLQRSIDFYSATNIFLDQFDRDMLALNLKACFAILSHLERKAAVKAMGGIQMNERNEHLNIQMYKHG